jgi:hypothetical protein
MSDVFQMAVLVSLQTGDAAIPGTLAIRVDHPIFK